jgi:peptidyl-prolyl cis-trans isomerase SurA
MYDIGVQMIDQMRQGVPFRAIAQEYSACPSAARGGDLGWLRAAEMDADLAEVVSRLGTGNVSRPLPHDGMLKLFAVRQKREAAAAGEPAYQVVYFGAPSNIGEAAFRTSLTRVSATTACRGAKFNTDLGQGVAVAELPMLPESQYQSVFHDVLAGLEVEKISDVIESEGAFHAVVLCEKDEGFGLPSRRVIENRLEAEELELISRRYLRDVERNSAVEVRLRADG